MHELAIAQGILDIVREEMAKHGAAKLDRVHIHHGRMANVAPEALTFAWENLIRGTDLEGAEMLTEEIAVRMKCAGCGVEFEPEDDFILAPCPDCGEDLGHQLLKGQELYVFRLEADGG